MGPLAQTTTASFFLWIYFARVSGNTLYMQNGFQRKGELYANHALMKGVTTMNKICTCSSNFILGMFVVASYEGANNAQ